MRKTLLRPAILQLLLALFLPAFAVAQAESVLTENVTLTKDIGVDVNADVSTGQSAESTNTASSEIMDNTVTEDNIEGSATLETDAFIGHAGILSINQAPGNLNNQANSVNISFITDGEDAFVHGESSVSQVMTGNVLESQNSVRTNDIERNSFVQVTGIVMVNQAAGHLNNQSHFFSITIGGNPAATLSPVDLGNVNAGNVITETEVSRTDVISDSAFQQVSGIICINQASGSMNNQATIMNISVDSITSLIGFLP